MVLVFEKADVIWERIIAWHVVADFEEGGDAADDGGKGVQSFELLFVAFLQLMLPPHPTPLTLLRHIPHTLHHTIFRLHPTHLLLLRHRLLRIDYFHCLLNWVKIFLLRTRQYLNIRIVQINNRSFLYYWWLNLHKRLLLVLCFFQSATNGATDRKIQSVVVFEGCFVTFANLTRQVSGLTGGGRVHGRGKSQGLQEHPTSVGVWLSLWDFFKELYCA